MMAQHIEVLANDLSLVPRTHMVKGKKMHMPYSRHTYIKESIV